MMKTPHFKRHHFLARFVLLTCSLCLIPVSWAQLSTEILRVEWRANQTFVFAEKNYEKPLIEGQEFSGYQPNFSRQYKVPSRSNYIVKVGQKQTVPAPAADLVFLKDFGIEIPSEIELHAKTVNAGTKRFLNVDFFPYVMENKQLLRIVELEVDFIEQQVPHQVNKDFKANSALSDVNSKWYKIAVATHGIYKLDKSWFDQQGIDLNGVAPAHINVYGNGSGRLPEYNGDPRDDDLAENEILFVGDANATFDEGEYFLFYGRGPHIWKETGGVFRRDLDIYSDQSYYFIRISSTDSPKRISQVGSTTQNETALVQTFNHYDIYEQDLVNLVGGGQRWYGELFDFELSRTFTFSIPNIVSASPIKIVSSLVSNARNSSNSFAFSIGGTTAYSATLGATSTDYRRMEVTFDYTSTSSSLPINLTVNRSSPTVLTYLDRIELNARRSLIFTGGQFAFRDLVSVGTGSIAKFELQNTSSKHFVWDVTNHHEPKLITGDQNGQVFSFNVAADSLREFIGSDGSTFLTPVFVQTVESQNLHGLAYAKLLIVTHPDFLSEANRLADIHRADGMSTHVATTTQVYNEFSSGMQDPTAIRWFAKMFYDRANGDPSKMPENLLLFGDGTYDPKDRVQGNNNKVVTYQFITSEDHLNALVSDDYFGMLDDNEAIGNSDMMDIGVGRMIVSDLTQAREQVDKIVQYMKKGINVTTDGSCSVQGVTGCSSYGDWRLKYVQVADDEENGYFILKDTEPQYAFVDQNHPEMNADKLYMDAYTQVTNAGGQRYPEVFDGITDRVQRGALVVNYVGHGGEVGLAEERVVTIPQIQSWTNWCNLNLFVSATCEFTRFDDPARVSAGEWAFLNKSGGAIALMTTTRSVFFGVNTLVGKSFYEEVFKRDENSQPRTFGQIMQATKNASGSNTNKRSFNLIGDPALRIALPEYRIVTDSINSTSPKNQQDTLRALSRVRIKGHIEDYSNKVLTDFNGILAPAIYDKKKDSKTLGQDEKSPVLDFQSQKNLLYKGKSSIKNGYFEFDFVVPKDINYAYGAGKISLYGNSETHDAGGSEVRFIVGGIDPNGIDDKTGPQVNMYFNNEKFIDGGLTDESPILFADLFDENGINTVGNGIGHDILAILDDKTGDPIVLNDYYNASLDTYQSGKLTYNFKNLEPGQHTLTLKVWDVNNNSSEARITFEVQKKTQLELHHVLNYPNPFTTSTAFYFEHNQWCSPLTARIQIFTITGKLVKTIHREVLNDCYRSDGIMWDGKDDFGDQLAKGVYVYKLTVRNQANETAEHIEKCVILR